MPASMFPTSITPCDSDPRQTTDIRQIPKKYGKILGLVVDIRSCKIRLNLCQPVKFTEKSKDGSRA